MDDRRALRGLWAHARSIHRYLALARLHSTCDTLNANRSCRFFSSLFADPTSPTAPSSQKGSHYAGAVSSAPLQLLRPDAGGASCSATQPVCLT
jgi:hypothetical protein